MSVLADVGLVVAVVCAVVLLGVLSSRPSFRRDLDRLHAANEDLAVAVGTVLQPALQRFAQALERLAR